MRTDWRDLPIAGVAVALFGVLGLGFLMQQEIEHQAEASAMVAHTFDVILEIQQIETGVAEAESAIRGSALTLDRAFLDDFEHNVGTARRSLAEAQRLTRDNPVQQERLAELAPVLDARLALLLQQHEILRGGGVSVPPPEARLLTRKIQEHVARLRQTEVAMLETRRRVARERTDRLMVQCRLAALSSVAIGFAGLLWISAERRSRRKAQDDLAEKHAMVDAVFEGTTDAVFAKDLDGRYLMMNGAGARLLGHTVAEVVGQRDTELFSPDSAREIAQRDADIVRLGVARTFEASSTAGDVTRTYLSTRAPFRDVTGRIVGLVGISRDITERKALENSKFREMTLLLELAELLQACRNPGEAHEVIGRMGARLFPEHSGAVSLVHPSRNLVEIRATWGTEALVQGDGLFAPDDCWALRRGRPHIAEDDYGMVCRHAAKSGATCCTPLLAQGEVLGVLHLGSPRPFDDAITRRAAFVAEQVSMAIANLELRETLRTQSIRDPLTGMYNRRFAEDALRRELLRAARQDGSVAVLMLDLDHFKRINDTFGHDAGDRVLREVGGLMTSVTNGDDVASRLGGEELAMVLPGVSAEEAWRKAEHLRSRIAALDLLCDGVRIGVTVSIGIALYPAHGMTSDTLFKAGDQALYAAKRSGRNRVMWATERSEPTPLAAG